MQTPEGKIKAKVKEYLHSRKVQSLTYPIEGAVGYYHMAPMGAVELDFTICYRGQYVVVETKAKGKKLAPRQKVIWDMMNHANALALVVESVEDISHLAGLLDSIDHD